MHSPHRSHQLLLNCSLCLVAVRCHALHAVVVLCLQGAQIDIRDIAPGDTKAGPRAKLPNCTACWGCGHTLEMMAMGHVMAGSHYSHEPGGSPSWLFRYVWKQPYGVGVGDGRIVQASVLQVDTHD